MNSPATLITDFTLFVNDNKGTSVKECLHLFLTDIAESGEQPYTTEAIEYLKHMIDTYGERAIVQNAMTLRKK